MAATLGVLIALAFKISGLSFILGLTILTWILSFLIFRIVSVASLGAAFSLPIYSFIFLRSRVIILLTLILSWLVILRHKPNILRLLRGEERKLF